jgi:hypothetical protein
VEREAVEETCDSKGKKGRPARACTSVCRL